MEINKATYISTSLKSSQIQLNNITVIDNGNYTCLSQNIVGEATHLIEIIVYSKY